MSDEDAAMDVLETDTVSERQPKARAGRKLDRTRYAVILDAALAVLAESGYDGMIIDLVAARAGAARATVYRRWATTLPRTIEEQRPRIQVRSPASSASP